MTPENEIKNAIMQWLWFHSRFSFTFIHDSVGIWDPIKKTYRNNNNNKYRIKGVPDILGIWEGWPLAIEVKTKTGRLSEDQKLFLLSWKSCGGIAFVARSLDDVIKGLVGVSNRSARAQFERVTKIAQEALGKEDSK